MSSQSPVWRIASPRTTPPSNYAGATFLALEPNDPLSIGPTDLLAATTLSVSVHPRGIRSFEQSREPLSALLRDLAPELKLQDVDPAKTAPLMAEPYELVKSCLRRAGSRATNAWVTASKICARKRPDLFPVRDNVVLDLLGLPKTYPVDWPAYQTLIGDDDVIGALDESLRAADGRRGVDVGDPANRLRHLDVALWMHATQVGSVSTSPG